VWADCSTIDLYCETIIWQQIFEGSFQVNGSRVSGKYAPEILFRHLDLLCFIFRKEWFARTSVSKQKNQFLSTFWNLVLGRHSLQSSRSVLNINSAFRSQAGDSSLKPTKVTPFTIIWYNSENNIRNARPFCRPLFCHSSVIHHFSYSSGAVMRLDYRIFLKWTPLTVLAGSALPSDLSHSATQ